MMRSVKKQPVHVHVNGKAVMRTQIDGKLGIKEDREAAGVEHAP